MKIEFYFKSYSELKEFASENNIEIQRLSNIDTFPRTAFLVGNEREKFLIL